MKRCHAPENQSTRRILLLACAAALAVAFTVSFPQPAHAALVTSPPVPPDLRVPAGSKAFFEGHAVGTQNYVCLPCPNPAASIVARLDFTVEGRYGVALEDQNQQRRTEKWLPRRTL